MNIMHFLWWYLSQSQILAITLYITSTMTSPVTKTAKTSKWLRLKFKWSCHGLVEHTYYDNFLKTFKLHSCYVPTFYDTLYFLGRQFGDTIYQRNLVTFFTHTANSYRGFLDTVKKCTWDNKHIKYSYTTFRWTSTTLGTVKSAAEVNRNLDTVKICIFGH